MHRLLSSSGELLHGASQRQHGQFDAQCEALISETEQLRNAKAQISAGFEDSVYGFDCDNAILEWKRADQKWALGKSMGQNKLVKELKIYAKNPDSVTKDNFVQICQMLSGTKKLAAHIDTLVNAKTVFAGIYNGEASDTARMKQMLDDPVKLAEQINTLSRDNAQTKAAFLGFARAFAADRAHSSSLHKCRCDS